MWLGFSIVGVMTFINGLNFFFPSVPSLRVAPYNLGELFSGRPWNAVGYTPLTFRPFLIGLVFLIPLDISFSCWFFFVLWKAQQIFESTLGWRARPLLSEQAAGAHISLFFIAIWIGRRHLAHVFKVALKPAMRDDKHNDSAELLDYRIAVWGLICGIGLILLFCWKAGMSLWAAGAFFALYLMTEIGITRIRAEVGSPFHDLHFAGPEILMIGAVGTRKIGPRNLSIMSLFWFLSRMHYSDVMPHQLEGFKLADRARMDNRWVFGAILIATVAGTFAAFWAILHSGYKHSNVVLQFFGREPVCAVAAVADNSCVHGHGRSRLLSLRYTVWYFPYVYASQVFMVVLAPGRLCSVQYVVYANVLDAIYCGMAHKMAYLEIWRRKGVSQSGSFFLWDYSRRICRRRILGVIEYCCKKTDLHLHRVVVSYC